MKKSLFLLKKILNFSTFFIVVSCSSVASYFAPDKEEAIERTQASLKADKLFWTALHQGNYSDLPQVIEELTAAYLQNPYDSVTAAHIGFAHIWRISERNRLSMVNATITNEIILSRKYFEEATLLDQTDARYVGFLASTNLIEASIFQDEKMKRNGYYKMLNAINMWPEFNLFTGGYLLSNEPANSKHFNEALEWQWQTLDDCIDGKIDRNHPNYSLYMPLQKSTGKTRKKSVCWNSWIAPHNFEGFFLNMGDLLVKNSKPELAKIIYSNAKLSDTYTNWKFKEILEKRIAEADKNVAKFNIQDKLNPPQIMINTTYSCMACHQN